MRSSLLFAALLLGTAAPHAAHACPPLDSCVVHLRTTVREAVAGASATAGATPDAPPAERVAAVVRTPRLPPARAVAEGEIEMPWIWKTLREQVYSRLPTYEEPHELRLTLAPVVVTSPSDTIPGLGVAGNF